MKKNEIIELGGVEYTLELNRESFLKIDQYCNIEKSMEIIHRSPYKYIENITDDTNPFAIEINDDKLEQEAELKSETMNKMISTAFWIWLYPNHKLPISKVKEIVLPYLETEEQTEWIGEKLGQYLQECISIREEYNKERKNLKALANK